MRESIAYRLLKRAQVPQWWNTTNALASSPGASGGITTMVSRLVDVYSGAISSSFHRNYVHGNGHRGLCSGSMGCWGLDELVPPSAPQGDVTATPQDSTAPPGRCNYIVGRVLDVLFELGNHECG